MFSFKAHFCSVANLGTSVIPKACCKLAQTDRVDSRRHCRAKFFVNSLRIVVWRKNARGLLFYRCLRILEIDVLAAELP